MTDTINIGDIVIIKTKEGKIYRDTICLITDKSIITSDGDSFDAESMMDDSAPDGSTNGSEILYIAGRKLDIRMKKLLDRKCNAGFVVTMNNTAKELQCER